MALLTVMLGVTFGLVLHFTQQSLEAESLRTLEALANNWQTASSPGLDDGTRVPYFALEINARGDIITTRGGYFDLSDREKLQKLIDIAVNSEDDIGEVPDYGLRFYRVVTRTSWRFCRHLGRDDDAAQPHPHACHCERGGAGGVLRHEPAAGTLAGAARCQGVGPAAAVRGGRLA